MSVTTQVRVRYAETDQMGIVYYANYLVWFEIGRVELLRSLGLAYSQLEIEHQCILPVVEASCRYRAPAHFDDEIVVKCWIEDANPRTVTIHYEMRLAEGGRVIATGHTRHVFVNREMHKARLLEKYFSMFGIPAPELR